MNALGQDAELRVGAAEEGAVSGEPARTDEGHGCGGGRQNQDEFIAAGCDEDAGGGVDHEQGAEHVQCEEDRKHAGEHAQDQRDTADELEGRDVPAIVNSLNFCQPWAAKRKPAMTRRMVRAEVVRAGWFMGDTVS